jgi:hypothetical protein
VATIKAANTRFAAFCYPAHIAGKKNTISISAGETKKANQFFYIQVLLERSQIMSKFLVIHPVGSEMTLESGSPIAKAIKAHLTSDAYWRTSYYVPDKGNLYCLWDASSKEAILEVLKKAAPDLPNEGPYQIELDIHSEDFR